VASGSPSPGFYLRSHFFINFGCMQVARASIDKCSPDSAALVCFPLLQAPSDRSGFIFPQQKSTVELSFFRKK
jgi:hypothetical protein